jgi:hypothetical protein
MHPGRVAPGTSETRRTHRSTPETHDVARSVAAARAREQLGPRIVRTASGRMPLRDRAPTHLSDDVAHPREDQSCRREHPRRSRRPMRHTRDESRGGVPCAPRWRSWCDSRQGGSRSRRSQRSKLAHRASRPAQPTQHGAGVTGWSYSAMAAVPLRIYWRGASSFRAIRAASVPLTHLESILLPRSCPSDESAGSPAGAPASSADDALARRRRMSSSWRVKETPHVNELSAESPAFGLRATPVSRAGRFGLGGLLARHGPIPELPCWALEVGSRSGRRRRGRGPRGTSPRTRPLGWEKEPCHTAVPTRSGKTACDRHPRGRTRGKEVGGGRWR